MAPGRIRGRLRNLRRIRSAYYFALTLRRAVASPRQGDAAAADDWFRTQEDPWAYADEDEERERHARAATMAAEAGPVAALEIGCGEGHFTTRLAATASSVLAVDLSEVALARARARCADQPHVRFVRRDITRDSIDGRFPLVVCMDVLCTLHWPPAQRRAIAAVRGAVEPGGTLVLSAVRQNPVVEGARWARALGAGGTNVVDRVAAPPFRRRETRMTEHHVVVRLQRDDAG